MKTRDKEYIIVDSTDQIDVNEVRFMDTGDTSIIWKIIAAGVFPEWVLEYLHHSAGKMLDITPSERRFSDEITKALAIREEDFDRADGEDLF